MKLLGEDNSFFSLKSRVCLHKINSRHQPYLGKTEFEVIACFFCRVVNLLVRRC